MSDDMGRILSELGIVQSSDQDSKLLIILGVVLALSNELGMPVMFSDIFNRLTQEKRMKLSKPYVHRILKSLIESRFIRCEHPDSSRKRYIANIETVVIGLEASKQGKERSIQAEMDLLHSKLKSLQQAEVGRLGELLVESLTGKSQSLRSRFISRVEDLHIILSNHVLGPAGEGDMVSSTMNWFTSFVDENMVYRFQKFLDAAMRGADVRYLVSMSALVENRELNDMSLERVAPALASIMRMKEEGYKIDVRIFQGPLTYSHSTLNDAAMALIITESPMTATFVTRDFNPTLIHEVNETFERNWASAISILDMTKERIESMGLGEIGLLRKMGEFFSMKRSGMGRTEM
ncbi:MAG: hypothetical protein JW779_03830 [Candidatus Thorarchaeota archaeon]|nr:hypothetical protein [Candidatus Thorarchaeota archaeon]